MYCLQYNNFILSLFRWKIEKLPKGVNKGVKRHSFSTTVLKDYFVSPLVKMWNFVSSTLYKSFGYSEFTSDKRWGSYVKSNRHYSGRVISEDSRFSFFERERVSWSKVQGVSFDKFEYGEKLDPRGNSEVPRVFVLWVLLSREKWPDDERRT